jgi:glutathione S-transferase
MPAFVLHGSRTSTNTMRVRLTLAEGNITDYEIVVLDLFKGEQKVSRRSFVQTMLVPKLEESRMVWSFKDFSWVARSPIPWLTQLD